MSAKLRLVWGAAGQETAGGSLHRRGLQFEYD